MQSYVQVWGGANVNRRENTSKNVTATCILECFMHMKNEEPVVQQTWTAEDFVRHT